MIKIIIVDDNDFDREKLMRYLRNSKFQKYEFMDLESIDELDDKALVWKPDLIILDLHLPGSSGMDVLRSHNQKWGKVLFPIIIATGTGSESLAVEAMNLGALDYVVKEGLTPITLEAVVMRAIDKSHLQQKIINQNELISTSQKRLQLAMESANMGSWEWDTETDLIYWDPQAALIMGIEETLEPKPFVEFTKNVGREYIEDSFKRVNALESYKEYNYVFPVTHEDKSVHWVKNYGKAVVSQNADGKTTRFNGTSLDVTDQHLYKELQASILSNSRTDILSLNLEKELREQFVSSLSHDLRNPLAAAKLGTEMLMRGPHALTIQTSLERIAMNLARADHMIQDLLDANRIGAGQALPLTKVECDMTEIIGECLHGLRLEHGDRFLFSDVAPVLGTWDRFSLSRVFENLLTNAVKYGTPDTPITVTVVADEKRVRIGFNNKGPGLTKAEQEKIFKPFHRTSAADNSNVRGWGLGLTIVKGITEAHGGTVRIESVLHEDVTVTVELPIRPSI
jgi:signal transduction histidine kinase/DNA-binding response OmpR family regulator